MPSQLQEVAESLTASLNAATGPSGETWVLDSWTADSRWFYESSKSIRADLEVRVIPARYDIDPEFNARGKLNLMKVVYVTVMQRVGKPSTLGDYGTTSVTNDLVQLTEQIGRAIWELRTAVKQDSGYSTLELNAEEIPFSQDQMQSGTFLSTWEVVYV